jgi:7,8-didemethyl-8-hydroxy-5-deazariboflavin synthase CofH subunit
MSSAASIDLAECLLRDTTAAVREVLERGLADRELSEADARTLLTAQGRDLQILCAVADWARARDVGDEVSYVVNRNLNSTNVCYVGCSFCGFSRHMHDEDAYDRGLDDMLERAREAWQRGASELCIQGGIHPKKDGFWYQETIAAIKAELPEIHIHGLSPEEIHWGHQHSGGMSLRAYLELLKETGLGTIPGTAAEILDDELRRILSPRKLKTQRWLEIVRTAHQVGLRSSSTLMYGHIESPSHIARHLAILRELQKETGGFTEFVPLGFIHRNTRLYREQGSRAGASMPEDLRLVAVGRLFLRPWIPNIQVSWVKMGQKLAQVGLLSGANDFGGTLMEESISKAAGSEHGDHLEEDEIRLRIAEIGRPCYERTTTYGRRVRTRAAEQPHALAPGSPLASVALGSGY